MIEVALSAEPPWPAGDWDALATRAVLAAVRASAHAALITATTPVEVSLRLTSDEEVRDLNRHYRGKDKATNVLSFPMETPDLPDGDDEEGDDCELLLGDIVLAYGVCAAEAADKRVSVADHASHLVVHGTLHLLGHDHELGDGHADAMEELERVALATLGIADPYAARGD